VRLYARGIADAVLEGKAAALQGIVQAVTGGDEEFVEVAEGQQ
jgi:small subunit ribosomal protein S2